MGRWRKRGGLFGSRRIGLDLGTANTLIDVEREGIVLNEPSVVAVWRDSGRLAAVGMEAKRMLGRTPEGIRAVRPLKDGVIAYVDETELMIRHFLREVLRSRMLKIRPVVVVGVPSGITELERRAVRSSAHAAGAKEVFMVSEPMAAAVGVGLPVETPLGNMVLDIGGGTSEIAVIALSGSVADTSIKVGGDELDQAILDFCRDDYGLLIGESTAERIKIQIGSVHSTDGDAELQVNGRDLIRGIPKTVVIGSTRIRECLKRPVELIVAAVRRALERTPPELAADIMDRGVMVTGGGALIKGLDNLLQEDLQIPIHLDKEPLTCVVRGCGMIAQDLERYRGMLST